MFNINSNVSTTSYTVLQKIEAPVRDQANPSDGGPPMDQRLGANDQLFVQEDGAKEKSLLGTGQFTLQTSTSLYSFHVAA